jgi:hypothetical protein
LLSHVPTLRHSVRLFPLRARRDPLIPIVPGAIRRRVLVAMLDSTTNAEVVKGGFPVSSPRRIRRLVAANTAPQVLVTVHESSPGSFDIQSCRRAPRAASARASTRSRCRSGGCAGARAAGCVGNASLAPLIRFLLNRDRCSGLCRCQIPRSQAMQKRGVTVAAAASTA